MKTAEETLDSIHLEFLDSLESFLPKSWVEYDGYSGPNFHATLTPLNEKYKGSEYYFDGAKKFIHWTSIQNIMSIINNREIRLYNLHSSSDPNEFKYAATKLSIPNDRIDHAKTYLYTFSFCNADEINNSEMWNKFGHCYKGAALEFEITNSPANWENFMLSKVYYELPIELIDLQEKLQYLKNKYLGIELDIDLGRLIAFHKEKSYSDENEIRLSNYYPFDNLEAYWKYCPKEIRIDKNGPRIIDYLSLKLWVDNDSIFVQSSNPAYDRRFFPEEGYFKRNPQIKITNIYFGQNCGIENRNFDTFRQMVIDVIKHNLGYQLDLHLNLFNNGSNK